MGFINITSLSYWTGSLLFVFLGLIYARQSKQHIVHWSLACICLVNALWLLGAGFEDIWLLKQTVLALFAEMLRYVLWMFALIVNLKFFLKENLPRNLIRMVVFNTLVAMAALLYNAIAKPGIDVTLIYLMTSGLVLSIITLMCVEQLFRNIDQNRQIKLLCLNLGMMFIFDIYLFTNSLTTGQLDQDLWQARAVVSVAGATIMLLGALVLNPTSQESASFSLSRPIAFYSTSIITAGTMIVILVLGSLYVRNLSGTWGTVVYTLFLFASVLSLFVVFASSTARQFLSVLINKHFFSHKYDYRTEWLKLISRLSQPTMPGEINKRGFDAVREMVKSTGGALWVKEDHHLKLVHQQNINVKYPLLDEAEDSDFCTILRKQQWVFIPGALDNGMPARYNEYLPDWIKSIPNVWLILPLLTEHDLFGFMVLTKPKVDASLTWEDRDLLKTVGRQVANYLSRHRQAEQLSESRQFDTFNRLSAFVMHDLKNLIAQQALLVKNATKHKDNPAFIEDSFKTIDNSVMRMSGLLQKLQRNQPSEIRAQSLNGILLEASKKCQGKKPTPTLRLPENNCTINADRDRLVMAVVHLLTNAQDATPASGFIDINVSITAQTASITIEDNGQGMSEDFIQTRLFKPFDSTKEGKGMGIGVYQAKEIAVEMKGSLRVESAVNEGTTFTMELPITAAKQAI